MTLSLRATALVAAAAVATPAGAVDLVWSAQSGFQMGFATRLTGTLTHPFGTVPLGLAGSVGYTATDPGDPAAARRIFINDATNGTPIESGHVWDLRLDALVVLKLHPRLVDTALVAGVRRAMFTGRFRFVGGNEDFLVESELWGLGAGVRGALPVNPRWAVSFSAGIDWYPAATIYSHDTSYSSDGTSVNPRAGYRWSDANRAVNQPELVPSVLVGVSWRP